MNIPKIDIDEFITGEKLEYLCDIDCEKDEDYEQAIQNNPSPQKTLIVFCQTHKLKNIIPVLRKYKNRKFIMISHNSDGSLEYDVSGRWFDYQWKKEDNIYQWFSQNCDVKERFVTPIPIGLENEYNFKEGARKAKHELMVELTNADMPKENKMFICFRRGTNKVFRSRAYEMFTNLSWTTCQEGENNIKLVESFFNQMARHQFILCLDGNGYDTHRIWEALYMGCIPIVQKHVFTEYFAKYLPIIVIKTLEQISLNMLNDNMRNFERREFNYNLLKMSYWRKVIKCE